MKRVVIVGSTGSVGRQALDVVAASTDITVVGLACGCDVDALLMQAQALQVEDVAIADESRAATISSSLCPELRVRSGPRAAARLVNEVEADLVLNAIVGFAGLDATVASLEKGTELALSNKESLVSGGSLVTRLAERRGVRIIPVDSEHSAIFQLLRGVEPSEVASLVVTASGGPFRGRRREDLRGVTVEEALAHPTWTMGAKITIDSATLMNKGLEIIEAHHLFGVEYDDIEVVVHPASLVHSLVRLTDGALLAHLGRPDMRVPIAFALHYPHRLPCGAEELSFGVGTTLELSSPAVGEYPALDLARAAGKAGDAATCALNAANEIAVYSFLGGEIGFLSIVDVVKETVDALDAPEPSTFEDVSGIDAWARSHARELCARLRAGGRESGRVYS